MRCARGEGMTVGFVKLTSLHFARTVRALRDILSEFRAARFDNGRLYAYIYLKYFPYSSSKYSICKYYLTGDARLEFLRNSGPAPEMKMERAGQY